MVVLPDLRLGLVTASIIVSFRQIESLRSPNDALVGLTRMDVVHELDLLIENSLGALATDEHARNWNAKENEGFLSENLKQSPSRPKNLRAFLTMQRNLL